MPDKITGKVVRGEGRGKQIGFPTANLEILNQSGAFPEFGVWASRVKLENVVYDGATSIGLNTTFDSTTPTFETYILDFDADIYGKILEVELVEYIRPMEKFGSVEKLIEQIARDVEIVKQILSKN